MTLATALSTVAGAYAQGAVKPTLVATFSKWTTWSYSGSYSGKGEGKGEGKGAFGFGSHIRDPQVRAVQP